MYIIKALHTIDDLTLSDKKELSTKRASICGSIHVQLRQIGRESIPRDLLPAIT